MASIVEKETGRDADRNLVAAVFVNRLKKGMRLQTDPTVIYGLGDKFDGNLRKIDLQTDTPYNTYTRGGLPPSPIALPGLKSLHSALIQPTAMRCILLPRAMAAHIFIHADGAQPRRQPIPAGPLMFGKFITLEGIDGAGKSTHLGWLQDWLRERAIEHVLTREPGGTPSGEKLRELLLHHDMHLETETLLMFARASRTLLAQVILPALQSGSWVVSDGLFTDATFAYQGGGRGLGIERIEVLERWVQNGLQPDPRPGGTGLEGRGGHPPPVADPPADRRRQWHPVPGARPEHTGQA